MPLEVRRIATSVGEKSKLDAALAEVNLASTKLGSASGRSSSIFMGHVVVVEARRLSSERRRAQTNPERTSHFNSPHFITPSLSALLSFTNALKYLHV